MYALHTDASQCKQRDIQSAARPVSSAEFVRVLVRRLPLAAWRYARMLQATQHIIHVAARAHVEQRHAPQDHGDWTWQVARFTSQGSEDNPDRAAARPPGFPSKPCFIFRQHGGGGKTEATRCVQRPPLWTRGLAGQAPRISEPNFWDALPAVHLHISRTQWWPERNHITTSLRTCQRPTGSLRYAQRVAHLPEHSAHRASPDAAVLLGSWWCDPGTLLPGQNARPCTTSPADWGSPHV